MTCSTDNPSSDQAEGIQQIEQRQIRLKQRLEQHGYYVDVYSNHFDREKEDV